MKKILIILTISFTMFGCFQSSDIDKKSKTENTDKDLDLEKLKEEFRKKNKVIFNFDSININYSIEINKYLNKNIYSDNFTINDIYEKDSLLFMSINSRDEYFLDLEINQNQLDAFYKTRDSTMNTYFLDRIENLLFKSRIIVFNLSDLYKIKDNDTIILTNFRGKGKLIDYKKLD